MIPDMLTLPIVIIIVRILDHAACVIVVPKCGIPSQTQLKILPLYLSLRRRL
ncbi:hypothetical protein HOLleu_33880 [Holothuria leucospilota]|uniref:Uncharacterized protein n=1 Tax=Holothuria leucospilota TaxID=206669 RepID=A0A9Q0YQY5_HOLLE|nr:hypothetical protein HOLleu_33880 [Holothuria leucospilota]